jgi:hypothetical protein
MEDLEERVSELEKTITRLYIYLGVFCLIDVGIIIYKWLS